MNFRSDAIDARIDELTREGNTDLACKTIDERIAELEKAKNDLPEQETEVYSRIVGYYRSVSRWNTGKQQEFNERTEYELEHSHAPKMVAVA